MSRPNNDHQAHDEWDELAVGYALTALEPDEMERFIDHLVSFCPQCQQSVDDTAGVGAELATALPMPAAPPSDALRDSVLRAAFAARAPVPQTAAEFEQADRERPEYERIAPVTPLPRRPQPRSDDVPAGVRSSGAHRVSELSERRERRTARSAGWLVAAAAAVVAVVMSVTAVMSMQSRSRTAADGAGYRAAAAAALGQSGRIIALKDNSGADVASVVAHSGAVSVVSLDMTPNSSATSYVLWGINGKTTNPVALGVFDVKSSHVQTAQVATDARGYSGFTSYAVSHEKGHTPPATPTTIVATGSV